MKRDSSPVHYQYVTGNPTPTYDSNAIIKTHFFKKGNSHLHRLTEVLEGVVRSQLHTGNLKSPEYKPPRTYSLRLYLWCFIQEDSQVVEVARCQFLSLFDPVSNPLVGHKAINDANTAGKGKKKSSDCVWSISGPLQQGPFLRLPSPATAFPLRPHGGPATKGGHT